MNKTTSSNYGNATYWLKPKAKVFYSFFSNYVGSFAFLFIIITYTKIKECLVNKILAYRSFPQIKGVHRNDPPIYHGRWWSAATFLFFVSSWQLCLRGNMKTRLKRFRFARISQKWFNQRRGLLRRLSKIHASGVMGFRSPLHLANVWNNVSSNRLKQLALS